MDREHFTQFLRDKGLKVTNQRIGVLEALSDSEDSHLTAEEIYDVVRLEYPEIGLATVYRTIQLLLELQLIDQINLDDGCVRYEVRGSDAGGQHHHHHLICLSCGRVFSFNGDLLETLEEYIRDKNGFQVVDHKVQLYGHCKECQEKMDGPSGTDMG